MGFDTARFMVNLFLLLLMAIKWLLNTKKRGLGKARRFCNTSGFLDDLCAIDHRLEFDGNFNNIYPSELQLKQ